MTQGLSPLRDRLRKAAQGLGVPIDVVEFDYGLSYVLAAVYARNDLRESFVFTAVGGLRGDELERITEAVARDVEHMLGEYGPFLVTSARRPERGPHPSGQEAFVLQIQFPWQRSAQRSIKVEITVDEPLALAPERRPLLHPYGEALAADLLVYRLEEIAVDLPTALEILPQKCAVRAVSFDEVDDFFPPIIVSEAERRWETSLADLVRPLPVFDDVIAGLRGPPPFYVPAAMRIRCSCADGA